MKMGWGMILQVGVVVLTSASFGGASTVTVSGNDVCMLALSGASEDRTLDFYATAAANFIKKYGRVPSENELADQAKVQLDDVREFFNFGTPASITDLVTKAREMFPAVFDAYQKKALPKWTTFFRKALRGPTVEELAASLAVTSEDFEAIYGRVTDIAARALETQPDLVKKVRKAVVRKYTSGCQQRRSTLSLDQLAGVSGVSIDEATHWFGTHPGALFADMQELKREAVSASPRAFVYVEDADIFTPQRKQRTMEAFRTRKRALVTTAVAGVSLHEQGLEALRNMAKKIDAEVFVIPANMEVFFLDPTLFELDGVHVLTEDLLLTPEVKLSTLEILPKMIRPTTGLQQRGRRGQLQFYASPKQWVDTVATLGEDVPPHVIVSTGAITQGSYRGGTAVSQRTNRFGEEDHVIGAVLLEKSTSSNRLLPEAGHGQFHFRHIEYRRRADGVWGFSDLGKFYTAENVQKQKGYNLHIEIHVGDTDQRVFEHLRKVMQKVPLELVTVHDIFNGHSINDHESKNLAMRGKAYESGRLVLRDELRSVVAFLDTLLSLGKFEVDINVSNHDEWIKRYLESGRWIHEPHNYVLASELNHVYAQGQSPLQYIIDKIAREEYGRDILKRVRFMKAGEEKRFGDCEENYVETGQHGDAGANGARGSINSTQRASSRSMSGHTHTYRRRNGNVEFGTLTKVRLGYNMRGATNWVQGVGLVAPDGSEQVLMFTDGEWFADDAAEASPPEQFFYEGYPQISPRPEFAGTGGSLDSTSAFRMFSR